MCQNPLRTIKCLKYTWWGADPRVLLNLYIALIMSRLEYGGFLFHNLSKSSSLKLMRLQYKALRFVLGLRNSTPTNVILAEAKEPPLNLRRDYICRNFLTRVLSCENHPLIHKIEAIIDLEDDPIVVNRFMNIPLIDNFRVVQKYSHIISKHSIPLGYSFHFNSLLFIPNVCTLSDTNLADPPSTNVCFLDTYKKELKDTYCLFTDGSINLQN